MLDLLTDPWPAMRRRRSPRRLIDPEGLPARHLDFDRDPDWSVRAALANALGSCRRRAALALQELAPTTTSRARTGAQALRASRRPISPSGSSTRSRRRTSSCVRPPARLMGERKSRRRRAAPPAAFVRGETTPHTSPARQRSRRSRATAATKRRRRVQGARRSRPARPASRRRASARAWPGRRRGEAGRRPCASRSRFFRIASAPLGRTTRRTRSSTPSGHDRNRA